jgi:hypothetical protein
MSRFIPCRVAVVLAALVLSALAQAVPAWGADSFTPNPVNVTLAPGGSTTVHKTLHLDALPARADIVIAIDTTGSMCGAIAQAKAQATALVNNIDAAFGSGSVVRYALVDFKDYPVSPYGDPGDYPYLLREPLTPGAAPFQAAVNLLTCGGGNDGPEAYNVVFHNTAAPPFSLTFDPNAVRFLVVLGDNIPHDTTQQSTFSSCSNTAVDDPIGHTATTINELNTANITMLMINFDGGGLLSCYQQLAGATGGSAVNSGGNLSNEIISQIQAAAAHIDAVNLAVSGQCPPIGISFSPAPPYGPFTAPIDIAFDETISAPLLPPGVYSCAVTAVVDGISRAIQHVNVTVGFPTSTPGCKVTYGGTVTAANGDAASFGGNAKADGLKGQEEYQDHGPATNMNVHSIDVRAVVCNDSGTTASIFGNATVDGGGSEVYRLDVTDSGEPGAGSDTYRIRLSSGYDSGVKTLAGGNIQIH